MKPDFPPLTVEERARMVEDFSDAAVAEWAARLHLNHGDIEGVKLAQAFRTGFHDSTPGAAFWSRVIAQLLRLDRPAPKTRAEMERALAEMPEEDLREISICKKREQPPRSSAYPIAGKKPSVPTDPEQGNLF